MGRRRDRRPFWLGGTGSDPLVISTDPGLDPGRSRAQHGGPLVISTGAVRQHGGVEKPRPHGAGRFLHFALRAPVEMTRWGGRVEGRAIGTPPPRRTAAAPLSSFRRTSDLIRGVAVRQHGGPLVISTGAVRQHGGVEKPRPRGAGRFLHFALRAPVEMTRWGGRARGFSPSTSSGQATPRLQRSGRNDGWSVGLGGFWSCPHTWCRSSGFRW